MNPNVGRVIEASRPTFWDLTFMTPNIFFKRNVEIQLTQPRVKIFVRKGVCNKKWTWRSNTKFSVNIGPTETYCIPNEWKLNDNFAELCRFEIAAMIG